MAAEGCDTVAGPMGEAELGQAMLPEGIVWQTWGGEQCLLGDWGLWHKYLVIPGADGHICWVTKMKSPVEGSSLVSEQVEGQV